MKDIPEDIPDEVIERLYDNLHDQIDKALNDIQKNVDRVEDGRLGISKIYYLLALKRLAAIGVEQLTNSQPEKLPNVPVETLKKYINIVIKNSTAVVAVHKEIE